MALTTSFGPTEAAAPNAAFHPLPHHANQITISLMAREKKRGLTPFKKIAIILGILVLIQAGIFFFVDSPAGAAKTESEARAAAMEKGLKKLDESRQAMAVTQDAINRFRAKRGQFPPNLQALVPEFIASLPNDPATGSPFSYRLEGVAYVLGNAATTGGGKGSKDASVETLLALFQESPEESAYLYDPGDLRDPFEPFTFAAPKKPTGNTPLEQMAIEDLQLSAVLTGVAEPAAILQDINGQGYTVKRGMKVGLNGGEVIDIQKDRVLILESEIDFTGERRTRTVELSIRKSN